MQINGKKLVLKIVKPTPLFTEQIKKEWIIYQNHHQEKEEDDEGRAGRNISPVKS